MKTDPIVTVLTSGVIIFSGLAAAAWLRSATSRVLAPGSKPGDLQIMAGDEPGEYSFTVDGVDVIATAALQTKWNTWAAWAACAAAVCQAFQSLPWSKMIG